MKKMGAGGLVGRVSGDALTSSIGGFLPHEPPPPSDLDVGADLLHGWLLGFRFFVLKVILAFLLFYS
jgi:hypothetical protein